MKNSKVQNFFQITAAICLIALCLGLPFAAVYAADQQRISHTQQVSGSPQPPASAPAETEPPVTEPPQPVELSTGEKLMLLLDFRDDPEMAVTVFPSYVDTMSMEQFNGVYEHITQEVNKLTDAGFLPQLDLTWGNIQYDSPDLEYVRYTKGDQQVNTWAMSLYTDYTLLLVMDADTYTVYELMFHYNNPEEVPVDRFILPADDDRLRVYLEEYWATPVEYYSVDLYMENELDFRFNYMLKLRPEAADPSKLEYDYALFITAYSMVLALETRPIYGQVSAW